MRVAAVGDTIFCPDGICPYRPRGPYQPPGFITDGCATFLLVGRRVAREGDPAICGGPTVLIEGASRFLVQGRRVHRIGDGNTCNGFTVGPGIANVLVGE